MKIKSLLIGMLACSAMVACTNEDPIDNGNENLAAKSDKAYLAVKLVDANNTSSRGAGDLNNPFHYGATDENAVNSVEFYFYYDGVYETFSKEVNFEWTTNGTNDATTNTIEKYSNAVVVLRGLSEQNQKAVLPNGVLCVINAPSKYIDGSTEYNDLQGLDYDKAMSVMHNHYATTKESTNYFIMTNSAFQGATSSLYVPQANFGNYLAPIAQTNFMLEEPTQDAINSNAVKICVERLAAKVEVDVTGNKINAEGMALGEPVEFRNITIDEETGKATTTFENKQLYLKVLGWGLSGTNKNNYAIKNIDTSWNFGDFTWNDPANNRSYWAKSTNYGNGTYPANFADAVDGATNKEEEGDIPASTKTDASNYTLNYFSWNELDGALGDHAYCMENTNTDAILKANFASSLTNVLVKAQVYVQTTSGEGESATTTATDFSFVRYNNTFYTPESFLAQVWNQVNLQYYYKKDDNTYALWSPGHLTEVNIYDGKVKVELSSEAPEEWYTRAANGEGGYTYTKVEPQINSRLEGLAIEAEYFNEGMMYYAIPVEHLRGGKYDFDASGNVTLNEADYGIVRNHYYNISLKSISNLGTSVYDPNEDIIVQIVDNKTYAISAKINILSWKVVNQEAEL